MPSSAIDSVIFRNMFGSPEVRAIWSDEYRTQRYLDWEAALARAQASLGLIPQEAADEITRVCKVENIDFAKLEAETLTIGYPVLGVVHQIAKLCRGDAGNWCHWGATTQDVTDSATILQIRASFEVIARKLDEAIAATCPWWAAATCSRRSRSPSASRWRACSPPSGGTASALTRSSRASKCYNSAVPVARSPHSAVRGSPSSKH
jgi:hypothetical protein